MLPVEARERLLHAVPSFVASWTEMCAVDLRGEDEAVVTHEFVSRLGRHLGGRLAAGERHEAEWAFAELEAQLRTASDDCEATLRIGLLESLAHGLLEANRPLSLVGAVLAGPSTRAAWNGVRAWVDPPSTAAREG